MRKSSVMRLFVMASAALVIPMIAQTSGAQGKGKGKKPPPANTAPANTGGAVELDAPTTKPVGTGAANTAPKDLGPPPQAGQMTEEAAQAKRLFDGEKWGDAALALYRVYKGETGDDEGNKQLAQYHLAIALYRLKFYQASYGIFSEIADKPNHLKFNETLLWLAKLATELPEPADIVERVGKYNDAADRASSTTRSSASSTGSSTTCSAGTSTATASTRRRSASSTKVDRAVEVLRPGAVLQRHLERAAPQVGPRGAVVPAHRRRDRRGRRGRRGRGAHARPRVPLDGAHVLLGVGPPRREQRRRPSTARSSRAAVKYWNKVDVAQRVLARRALRGVVGVLHGRRLRARARQHPHDRGAVLPELVLPGGGHPQGGHLLRELPVRRRDRRSSRKFQQKYEPIYERARRRSSNRFKGDEPGRAVLQVPEGRPRRQGATSRRRIKTVVENALSDRQLLRNLEYVRVLDDEDKRFKKAPGELPGLAARQRRQGRAAARARHRRSQRRQLARERYQRNLDELNEHLRDSAKILIDITAAQRNQLDAGDRRRAGHRPRSRRRNIVKPDEEHVLWPFDGEYWRDELGFYRQTITSKCGR